MAINTQTIRIDLNTGRTIPVAFAHQNDTNRQLTFQLYNNGVAFTPSSTTVKFAYKSPIVNGRYSVITGSQMASGTVSGNTVTVTLPAQYTQVSGVGLLTMILTTSGNTLRPVNIKFVCQGSADGDDTVLGASDWPEGLYDYMDNWLEENEPTEIANLKSDILELQSGGYVADQQRIEEKIDEWLDDHPEATTTVEDGSITPGKFSESSRKFIKAPLNNVMKVIPIASTETGDSTLIIAPDKTTIVVDFHDGTNVANLLRAMTDNSVSHLDYCMISHYHADHVNGFITNDTLNNFIDSRTIFFLPQDVPSSFSALYVAMTQVKEKINQLGATIIQPTTELERAYTTNKDIYFEFYNVNHADYYSADNVDYNNCCLCAKLYYFNQTVFFSGDIGLDAQKFLCGSVGNVTIYKAHHHGSDDFQYIPWLKEVNPEVCYCCASSANEIEWFQKRQFIVQMNVLGYSVYSTTNNGTFYIYLSGGACCADAKAIGSQSKITSLDILFGSSTNYETYTGKTVQDIANAIPFNTSIEMYITLGRMPNLFDNTAITIPSSSTAFIVKATKATANYFDIIIYDILLGAVYIVPVHNGIVNNDYTRQFKDIKTINVTMAVDGTNKLLNTEFSQVASKIVSAEILYNSEIYHLVLTDGITPTLTIRDTEKMLSLLLHGGTFSTTRNITVRVSYIPVA